MVSGIKSILLLCFRAIRPNLHLFFIVRESNLYITEMKKFFSFDGISFVEC